MNNSRETNIRIETEIAPIRHISIECPSCGKWFYGHDILKKDVRYEYQLVNADCECPICEEWFSIDPKVKEVGHPEVYNGVVSKKTTWE